MIVIGFQSEFLSFFYLNHTSHYGILDQNSFFHSKLHQYPPFFVIIYGNEKTRRYTSEASLTSLLSRIQEAARWSLAQHIQQCFVASRLVTQQTIDHFLGESHSQLTTEAEGAPERLALSRGLLQSFCRRRGGVTVALLQLLSPEDRPQTHRLATQRPNIAALRPIRGRTYTLTSVFFSILNKRFHFLKQVSTMKNTSCRSQDTNLSVIASDPEVECSASSFLK